MIFVVQSAGDLEAAGCDLHSKGRWCPWQSDRAVCKSLTLQTGGVRIWQEARRRQSSFANSLRTYGKIGHSYARNG